MKRNHSSVAAESGDPKSTEALKALVRDVQIGSVDAGAALYRFVMRAAEPYLRSVVRAEDIEEELGEVVATVWDAIQDGAILRVEFLPSFVETLIWQRIRLHLQATGQWNEGQPALSRLMLVRGLGTAGTTP
jgi:hypothetical protein